MKASKIGLIAALSFCFILFVECSIPLNCIHGKGDVIEKELSLKEFEKIHLKNSATIYLNKSDKQRVVVKGQSNIIELLKTDVDGQTWEIKFDKCVKNMKDFEVHIDLPMLTEASIYGSGDILGNGNFQSNNLSLNIFGSGDIKLETQTKSLSTSIKGSGDINLKGVAANHDIQIAGSGDVKATDLASQNCSVSIKGSGDVRVNLDASLEVNILGSGDVYYSGNPANVNSNIKGSGEVKKL